MTTPLAIDIMQVVNLVKTVKCRVEATPEQRQAFAETMKVFADACNYARGVAVQHNTANKIRLQKLSWAFAQLQSFMTYKALERRIGVAFVDPHYTSQSCSRCGAIGLRQGLSFRCACGYRNHADYNAAYNLAARGHALAAGPSSCGLEATPVDAKGSHEQLRLRTVASPRL